MDSLPPDPPALAASAASAAAAVQAPRADWQVVHCGVARGVLYLTYTVRGQAGITPAFATPAVQRACAAAGYAVAASAPTAGVGAGAGVRPGTGRGIAVPISAARPGSGAAAAPRALLRSPPSFTPQATGSSLVIDGRNDGDVPYRCSIAFSWTSDDNPTGSRAYSGQATLAARQMQRVAQVGGGGRNLRFVGAPSYVCNAVE